MRSSEKSVLVIVEFGVKGGEHSVRKYDTIEWIAGFLAGIVGKGHVRRSIADNGLVSFGRA